VQTIVALLKWVDLRPDVDRLTGSVRHDSRFFGCSAADQAALEWALRLADRRLDNTAPTHVVALTAGPPDADGLLREALAAGASHVVRVDLSPTAASDHVATSLAVALESIPATLSIPAPTMVCAGDWSVDRGSGSVPAFVAARLGWGQALGLVAVGLDPASNPAFDLSPDEAAPAERRSLSPLTVTRRLDHGRREVLAVQGPAVLSFEGGTTELRRASLARVLRARDSTITVVDGPHAPPSRVTVVHHGPDRPRPRALRPPNFDLSPRERVLSITGALVERTPPRTVVATPDDAAQMVLDQLRTWGYLPE